MAVSITIPDTAWSRQVVSLSGSSYVFETRYNERSSRWYINITLGGVSVINSLKVVENVNLTGRYLLDNFNDGNLFCIKIKETAEPAGRDNFGIGKDYELWYLTNEEIETLGI